jgi:hypothetical protein
MSLPASGTCTIANPRRFVKDGKRRVTALVRYGGFSQKGKLGGSGILPRIVTLSGM